MNVPICKPALGDAEAQAAADVVKSGWVVQGPKVAEFERLFAEFVGVEHAVATTSCTTALHAALLAFGIGLGDEVVVPALTWVATANAVELCGAKPVFADVERDTFNVSRTTLCASMGRPAALIPVSLFGAPMQSLDHRSPIIEDCACALGAYREIRPGVIRHVGYDADVACFSFHPRKVITTGEGGMLVTRDPEVARRARAIRDHGASVSDYMRHHGPAPHVLPEFRRVGSNYRMTDIQGAIGVVQMRKLPRLLAARSERAARYGEMLAEVAWLRLPTTPVGTTHGWQSYVTWFAPEEPSLENVERLHQRRNQLMAHLAAAGVATRPGTHAVHLLDYYATKYRLKPRDFPNAYLADRLTLALPLYPTMTDEEQDYVVAKLKELGP